MGLPPPPAPPTMQQQQHVSAQLATAMPPPPPSMAAIWGITPEPAAASPALPPHGGGRSKPLSLASPGGRMDEDPWAMPAGPAGGGDDFLATLAMQTATFEHNVLSNERANRDTWN